MRKLSFLVLYLFIQSVSPLLAQPTERLIKIWIAPNHSDWTYKNGEAARFDVAVMENSNAVKNVKIYYEIGPEKMTPVKKDSVVLKDGKITLDGGTMKSAGFLRCVVTAKIDGVTYRNLATAGFEPLTLKPTVEMPTDFIQFWDKAKAELAEVPVDARMTLMPERCTETVNVYHVNLQNFAKGTRLYGILCIPKKAGKYPALLKVPGAGVRPYNGDVAMAEKGIITFEIGIHGIPVNLDPSVYTVLSAGALRGYQNYNLDDRDRFYYKRVYLGCVRANDFLVGLQQYDGVNLAVTGGSQGGALSVITAALDPRVKCLGAFYPALSDVTGYLHGRAGGWPHYFDPTNMTFNNTKEKIATCGYYDVVNFAKQLKNPAWFSWGFNDETCPPTSMYAAYNSITAPKSLLLVLETGHWTYPEQQDKLNQWLIGKLTGH